MTCFPVSFTLILLELSHGVDAKFFEGGSADLTLGQKFHRMSDVSSACPLKVRKF